MARDWLARLPALVGRGGGAVGPRGRARRSSRAATSPGWRRRAVARDGLDAVLKVQLPHPESAPEAVGLRAWAGDGAVLAARPRPRPVGAADRAVPAGSRPRRPRAAPPRRSRAGAAIGARLHARARRPTGFRPSTDVLDVVGRRASRSSSSRRPAARSGPRPPGARRRCAHGPRATRAPGAAARRPQPHQRAGGRARALAGHRPEADGRRPGLRRPPPGDAARSAARPPTPPRRSPSALEIVAEVMGVDRDALRGVVPRRRGRDGRVRPGRAATRTRPTACDAHVALLAPHLP